MEQINKSDIDEKMVDELKVLLEDGKEKEYLSTLDKYLAQVKIQESNEVMLSIHDIPANGIFIDLVDLKIDIESLDRNQLREGIINKLIQAQNLLPKGLHLVIRDAFRSRNVVQKLYQRYVQILMEKEQMTEQEADIKVRAILAMPDDIVPPGHMTGGAVDVVLAYDDGSKVPMEVNEDIVPRQKQSWSDFADLPEDIINNRKILFHVMKEVGFHNYPREYWHYSYGDAYWAVRRNDKTAIYGIPK